jgi:hypothetical protein
MSTNQKARVFWTNPEKAMIQETYDIMTHIRHPLQRLNKAIKKVLVPSRRRTIGTLSKVPWLVSSSTFPLPAKSPTLGCRAYRAGGISNPITLTGY